MVIGARGVTRHPEPADCVHSPWESQELCVLVEKILSLAKTRPVLSFFQENVVSLQILRSVISQSQGLFMIRKPHILEEELHNVATQENLHPP